MAVILQVQSLSTCYRLSSWALLVKFLSGECHRTSLMIKSTLAEVFRTAVVSFNRNRSWYYSLLFIHHLWSKNRRAGVDTGIGNPIWHYLCHIHNMEIWYLESQSDKILISNVDLLSQRFITQLRLLTQDWHLIQGELGDSNEGLKLGSFCQCTQPMRDVITL